jgi:hypothetical protein
MGLIVQGCLIALVILGVLVMGKVIHVNFAKPVPTPYMILHDSGELDVIIFADEAEMWDYCEEEGATCIGEYVIREED